jgi:hypothetical protein
MDRRRARRRCRDGHDAVGEVMPGIRNDKVLLWGLIIIAIVVTLALCSEYGRAQSAECWPEMKQVHNSMEDLQRVRVELEDQTKILRDIRDALKKRK